MVVELSNAEKDNSSSHEYPPDGVKGLSVYYLDNIQKQE
jgi:hypothetical protein